MRTFNLARGRIVAEPHPITTLMMMVFSHWIIFWKTQMQTVMTMMMWVWMILSMQSSMWRCSVALMVQRSFVSDPLVATELKRDKEGGNGAYL